MLRQSRKKDVISPYLHCLLTVISRKEDRNFDKSPIRTIRLRIIQAARNQMINFQFPSLSFY
jgi:hypothetical protein